METVSIEIQTFAALRDHFGPAVSIEIEPGLSVAGILERLAERRPSARELLSSSRLALGDDFLLPESVPDPAELQRNEVCLLPPASGG